MNNKITITKTKEVNYLQFNKLLEFQDKLAHRIYLKNNNIGFNLTNDTNTRTRAIEIISKELEIESENIIQSEQTHSDNIKEYNQTTEPNKQNILKNYDGYIVSTKGIATLTTFADCIPIFIYDSQNNTYANIHSGWRGIINQIGIKAINILVKNYNSKPNNLICCIGPNIGKECFLVNEDLVKIYSNKYDKIIKKYEIIKPSDFCNEKGKQYTIDNNLLLEELLKENGILEKNIINSNICTVCNSKDFHSRRAEGENFQKGGGIMLLK